MIGFLGIARLSKKCFLSMLLIRGIWEFGDNICVTQQPELKATWLIILYCYFGLWFCLEIPLIPEHLLSSLICHFFYFCSTTKYLKKAAITRTCAIAGFFLSIPLFLIGKKINKVCQSWILWDLQGKRPQIQRTGKKCKINNEIWNIFFYCIMYDYQRKP